MADRTLLNQEIYNIKNEIDDYIRNLDLFKLPLINALYEVLIRHSELILFFTTNRNAVRINSKKYCQFDFDDGQFEHYIQESLKWCIRWCYSFCEGQSDYHKDFKLNEITDILEFAYAYDIFFNQWWSFTKRRNDLEISGKNIKFIETNMNGKYFAEYDQWRKSVREQNALASLNSRRLNNIYISSKLLHESDFTLPGSWDFGKFTYEEYTKFSNALDSFLTEYNLKEIENGIIGNSLVLTMSKQNSRRYIIEKTIDEWAEIIHIYSGLEQVKIKEITNYLTYDPNDIKSDVSQCYFIPYEKKLLISSRFVNYNIRPERNFISLVARADSEKFSKLSNDLEGIQKSYIKSNLNGKMLLFAEGKTKEQKLRPGMDLLLLDPYSLKLLIIELKYRIPAYTSSEVDSLDKHIQDGVRALDNVTRNYIEQHKDIILEEYFGDTWNNIEPDDVEFMILINEAIGTGMDIPFNTPVFTLDHFFELIDYGLDHLFNVIRNGMRGYNCYSFKETSFNIKLKDYIFSIPAYIK